MTNQKETIIFYKEWLTLINSLPDKSRLEFYDTIFSEKEVHLTKIKDAHLRSVLDFVQQKVNKNHTKYDEVIKKRKEAGIKSGKARKEKATKRTLVQCVEQKGTKRTDSVNDSVNVNVNVSDSVLKKFKKPSLEEVKNYCNEILANIEPQSFIDFYESKGWKIGKNPMKDWKACARTWKSRADKSKPTSSKNEKEKQHLDERAALAAHYDQLEQQEQHA